jgi:hypothetical protein
VAAAGNISVPLTTNSTVRNIASSPAMPITMPWKSVKLFTLSL